MEKHKAKKSLGQNFLKSKLALKKIIEAGELKPTDTVLEIGPGKGALTEELLKYAGKVVAVEKDRELFELLKGKFAEEIKNGKLVLVEGDILEFVFFEPLPYKIVANIPYNITGAILKKFLSGNNQPKLMVLLVQKEVAERIVGEEKTRKESLLSISVKAYGEPKIIMKVPARYFSPAPKVDSAVIKINNISKKFFEEGVHEEKFWEMVRAGFAHKRKVLLGNLRAFRKDLGWPQIFASENLGPNVRAEELPLSAWRALYFAEENLE